MAPPKCPISFQLLNQGQQVGTPLAPQRHTHSRSMPLLAHRPARQLRLQVLPAPLFQCRPATDCIHQHHRAVPGLVLLAKLGGGQTRTPAGTITALIAVRCNVGQTWQHTGNRNRHTQVAEGKRARKRARVMLDSTFAGHNNYCTICRCGSCWYMAWLMFSCQAVRVPRMPECKRQPPQNGPSKATIPGASIIKVTVCMQMQR